MKGALLVLAVTVVALCVYVNSRPGSFHVERSERIAAPPESIFARVDDLHRWEAWSPWAKLDPHMATSYSGAAADVGAQYHWSGDPKTVGEGRMTITGTEPSRKVEIRLDFIKPFQATNQSTFTLAPGEGGTNVVWSLDGKTNFVTKAMGIFKPMDQQIGPDFARGLASLKAESEAAAAAPRDSTRS